MIKIIIAVGLLPWFVNVASAQSSFCGTMCPNTFNPRSDIERAQFEQKAKDEERLYRPDGSGPTWSKPASPYIPYGGGPTSGWYDNHKDHKGSKSAKPVRK